MKIFAASDIHSFFSVFKKELDRKGFEDNNPEHLLIICGDLFDRGPETVELINYINSLTNVVLVRGNHEDLLIEMLNRGHGERHDISNGTARTVSDLVDLVGYEPDSIYEICKEVEKIVEPFLSKFINYFETKNYIFVHGWIPCEKFTKLDKPWYQQGRKFEYDPDWRNCNDVEWEAARWINGINAGYINNVIEPNKTIICGHWHCSYGHYFKSLKKALKNDTPIEHEEFDDTAIWEPFIAEGIMAIDRCTAHTGEVNVVVLEDELLDESICTNS